MADIRYEDMERSDLEHACRLALAVKFRLDEELKDMRYVLGAILSACGGEVKVWPWAMISIGPKDVIETCDEPVTGAKIFRLVRASENGE